MLDTATRRRIDTARDILVGKVPDPKSQVEQITIALIYKFMDDMDAESEELGGSRSFFAGDFERYGWAKLMRSGLGGQAMLGLYAEAITRMPENPGIPPLFRSIFKNAYLPYRDPETLKMFLKVIDEFTYEHSERLGDAFEYLLSVLGSQGDAGQFRTPRHIIDFIVEVVDPKKTETVLDPACGTAGFLISSWKHILKANTDAKGGSTLTPDEKTALAKNFMGYDISPDMVRLSLVNLYLHGFADPHIYEYDTLTSQDRWNDRADVILANPPFMSPKGGIRPHNRFSVQSKRSEVLFVDYMAEHLTPRGRAGIIVPEGIIFQSGTAYKQLRKMLVEEYLVAVVSLPAGVFNPYSGVKTSILILDRALAKRTDSIAFFKVQNDGFGLGAQRREIDKNDLPEVRQAISDYLNMDTQDRQDGKSESCSSSPSMLSTLLQSGRALIVSKEKIAANGDWNLSGERYREGVSRIASYPEVALADLLEVQSGFPFRSEFFNCEKGFPLVRIRDIKPNRTATLYSGEYTKEYIVNNGDLIVGMDGEFNSVIWNGGPALLNQRVSRLHSFRNCLKEYVALLIPKRLMEIEDGTYSVTVKHLSSKQILGIEIPLPPLEVQKEIVVEIEGYQKVIDGARMVVDNYRPHIPIDPSWPMVELGDSSLFRVESGGTPRSNVPEYWDGGISWATLVDLPPADLVTQITSTVRTISDKGLKESSAKLIPADSVIVSTRATIGRIAINRIPITTNQGFKNIIIEDKSRAIPEFVALAISRLVPTMKAWATGGTFAEISKSKFCELDIPLPPLEVQKELVAEIETEQAMVSVNRELIARFEKKIQITLARVWGEEKSR